MSSQTAEIQPLLLPIPAVQQLLTCSRSTLRKLELEGALVPVRDGKSVRYLLAEVQAHISRLVQERDQKRGQGRPRNGDKA